MREVVKGVSKDIKRKTNLQVDQACDQAGCCVSVVI